MNTLKLTLFATLLVALAACSDNPTSVMDEHVERSSVSESRLSKVKDGPTVSTDKDDYAPGQTVTITGSGWLPGETVVMVLTENPVVCNPRTLTSVADSIGNFVNTDFSPEVHHLGVEFTLVATGSTSGFTAQTTFTDGAPIVNSFTLDGSATVISVVAGSSITVAVNATAVSGSPGAAAWKSTEIAFRNVGLGLDFGDTDFCDDTDKLAAAGTTNHSFVYDTTPLAPATYDVRIRAFNSDSCSPQSGSSTKTANLTITPATTNVPPTVDAQGPYSGDEGSDINIAGTSNDDDGDVLSFKWTYAIGTADAGASCSFGDDTSESTTVNCTDDGTYTLTLAVSDGVNTEVTDDATLTVNNVAPSIDITSPADASLYQISAMVSVTASFTDPGSNDTHTCTFDWDDGMTSGPVASGSPCSASHSYGAFGAGIFDIIVTVTDDDGASASDTVMVIVYDPNAGFVTGGGWIMSPAGAYFADPSLTGKATFGFVSKYKKGASIPTGNTEFQFHAGGLNFHSSTYDWLVVNKGGTNAQYKGTGTINGAGLYKFMLWATDDSPDTFRIKIWEDGGADIYDNGVDQAIGSGSIKVHTGK